MHQNHGKPDTFYCSSQGGWHAWGLCGLACRCRRACRAAAAAASASAAAWQASSASLTSCPRTTPPKLPLLNATAHVDCPKKLII